MPKIQYQEIKFRPETLKLISICESILEEYDAQGFDMTLRQLYYQFVSRDIIANKQSEYKRLGSIVNDARLAGLIDWNSIVDRTRNLRTLTAWDNPEEIIENSAAGYHLDRWATQSVRPEIWIEKDALAGVFERVAHELDVPLFSCRGYTSQSEVWSAAQRMLRHEKGRNHDEGVKQLPFIIHFGDHDPSGIDMSRDIKERLAGFGGHLTFKRLALNMKQVEEYEPPPNPAKLTDSRCQGYMARFGDESWELDALEPQVLAELVREAILDVRDDVAWGEIEKRETEDKQILQQISDRYDDVTAFLEDE